MAFFILPLTMLTVAVLVVRALRQRVGILAGSLLPGVAGAASLIWAGPAGTEPSSQAAETPPKA